MRALAVLALLLAPVMARADEHATLDGQESMFTTSGVPDHAMFTARNPTAAPVTLVVRAIHYGTVDGSSLRMYGVAANDHPVAGAITIPARGAVHLVVSFDGVPLADHVQTQFLFTLQATLAGHAVTTSTTVSRAIRDPIRNIQISS